VARIEVKRIGASAIVLAGSSGDYELVLSLAVRCGHAAA